MSALNIVAFPEDLDLAILARILEGGAAVARDAGVAIVGGHTIKDAEPKYGMAVTGVVDPQRIVTNAGALPGDVLVLTKPLGTGILTTALKRGAIAPSDLAEAVAVDDDAQRGRGRSHARRGCACGYRYHRLRSARPCREYGARVAGALSLRIRTAVPLMARVLELIGDGIVPGGTRHNAETHAAFTDFAPPVPAAVRMAFSDAQTSGGLLIAVASESLPKLVRELNDRRTMAAVVGEVREGSGIEVIV